MRLRAQLVILRSEATKDPYEPYSFSEFMRRPFLLATCFALLGCVADQLPRPSSTTPVVLISIDTLRSDHLPSYGYKTVETPHIDAFRDDAILYERAYSHSPLTLPSHATLFTGLLPAETRVRDNTGYELAAGAQTLAELLKKRGYATGAAVSAYVLRKGSGIERGFDFYDDEVGERGNLSIAAIQRDGEQTLEVAKTWLRNNSRKPVLFFFHLYEPHSPYEPPEPYRSRYSAYDGEIAKADEIVGAFIDCLKELDLYDKALIILFSDHGEGLSDHQEDEHGIFLYREALQVPLLVKLPESRMSGRTVRTPVQLSDIFPTVLYQTATRHSSRSSANARSLLPLAAEVEKRSIYSETYFPRFHFGWSDLHSLIEGDHQFIQAPQPELYDLSRDPGEKNNILAENRRMVAAFRRAITPLIRTADAPKPIDPEEASRLAALGYLGSAVPDEGPLPDPKTKTETFRQIRAAFKSFRAGDFEKSLAFYQELLKENPRMLDLWDVSARALMHLGRTEEAIQAAKEGLKLSPHTTHLALLIANLSLEIGKVDEAERHAELAVAADPGQAHEILARVALARGDLARAEEEAKRALTSERDRVRSLMALARVEKQKGNLEAALGRLDEAVGLLKAKKKPSLNSLHFLRGDVLARLGRPEEAEQAFREEIRLFPHEPQAYKNLILLYVTEGRVQEATRLIYDLEKASPTPPAYAAISQTLRVVGDTRGARFWALRGLRRYPGDRTLRKLAG